VPGRSRPAVEGDLPLLARWSDGFAADTGTPPPTVDHLARRLADGGFEVWDDDGPVSMAYAFPPVAGVRRVSHVYTPPAVRGRGYGSAVTAAVTRRALAGVPVCALYADRANPTSNGIYRRIGYRCVADSEEWTFAGGRGP